MQLVLDKVFRLTNIIAEGGEISQSDKDFLLTVESQCIDILNHIDYCKETISNTEESNRRNS